jgi:hypothetical protein
MRGAGDWLGHSRFGKEGRERTSRRQAVEPVYEPGNRVGKSWRLGHELEKRAEKPKAQRCAYEASGEPSPHPADNPPSTAKRSPLRPTTPTSCVCCGFVASTPHSRMQKKRGAIA